MQTIPRRINDDETEIIQLIFDLRILGKCFFCRIRQKCYLIFQPIYFGIVSCISDRFFYDFYPHEFISFPDFQKTYAYTSGSTIEIENSSFDMTYHTHRLAEQLLGSECIGLKKRERGDSERDFR